MGIFISNSFSINMLPSDSIVRIREIDIEKVKTLLLNNEFTSCIGHSTTATVLSSLLNINVPSNRISIKLKEGDKLIVFQIMMRLEEGRILTAEEIATLPFKFFLVEILPDYTIEALYHW